MLELNFIQFTLIFSASVRIKTVSGHQTAPTSNSGRKRSPGTGRNLEQNQAHGEPPADGHLGEGGGGEVEVADATQRCFHALQCFGEALA